MLSRASLGLRIFLYVASFVVGCAFVVSGQNLYNLVLLWSVYVVAFSVASVLRDGLVRGLRIPTATLALVALIGLKSVLAACFVVWLLCILLSLCGLVLRSGFRRLGMFMGLSGRDQGQGRGLVSIVVRERVPEVCAASVLAQFGFEEAE
jgi:hypothetical protein